ISRRPRQAGSPRYRVVDASQGGVRDAECTAEIEGIEHRHQDLATYFLDGVGPTGRLGVGVAQSTLGRVEKSLHVAPFGTESYADRARRQFEGVCSQYRCAHLHKSSLAAGLAGAEELHTLFGDVGPENVERYAVVS